MTEHGADGSDTRRIVVVRHASTEQFSSSDHARRLTEGGERDSSRIGEWLASVDVHPEVVLVSSAARARRTADLVVAALGDQTPVVVLDELYGASPYEVVELCARIDADVACAAVVGHNPTMAMLADLLVAADDAIDHFPTSAVAVVDVPGTWNALPEGSGTLVHLHRPHDT